VFKSLKIWTRATALLTSTVFLFLTKSVPGFVPGVLQKEGIKTPALMEFADFLKEWLQGRQNGDTAL
jgi:hypothetical protein